MSPNYWFKTDLYMLAMRSWQVALRSCKKPCLMNGAKTTVAPSSPVLILGMAGAPQTGEKFKVYEDESIAKDLGLKRAQINRELSTRTNKRSHWMRSVVVLPYLVFQELKIIVKGDVDGSIEALSDSLIKLSIEKIQVSVIHKSGQWHYRIRCITCICFRCKSSSGSK